MGIPSLLPFSLLIALLVCAATSRPLYLICPGTNYTANSPYQSNLRSLLSSLAADIPAAGYYTNVIGDVPDTAYGLVLCRGDVDAAACQECVQSAARDVLEACPYKKNAIIWYDACLLRYTDKWTFPSIAERPLDAYMWNTGNISEGAVSLFKDQVGKMMGSLATYAAYSSLGRYFATGEAAFTNFPRIFGLVQCTPDQPATLCYSCLRNLIVRIPEMFSASRGARTLGTICYFRYEVYSFYNGSAMVRIPLPTRASPPALPPTSAVDPTSKENKHPSTRQLPLIITGGVVLGLIGAACVGIWKMKASKKKNNHNNKIPFIRSLRFDLSTLRAATENFSESNKLGEGGFGVVYKGVLAGGQAVAVKRLWVSSGQGLEQLRNEVELLTKQEHRNLVRLLGVCLEEEKLLIYEYMPNTSLDKFLFDLTKNRQLVWQLRYKIIEGVARGLLYLHEESRYTVIHRDLKASNILLDANMNPKISDFGISRLFSEDQTHESASVIAGTFGYMAPEYVFQGQFSNKSDVFSFGVLVLEIVTGRSNSSFSYSEGSINLLSYVWEHWTTGAIDEVIDPSLGGVYQQIELLKCIYIGLLCVQESIADRPTMSHIVLMLDGLSTTVHVLLQPAFYPGRSETNRLPESTQCSLNKLDISDLDPR